MKAQWVLLLTHIIQPMGATIMNKEQISVIDPVAFSLLIINNEKYIKKFISRALYNQDDLEDVYQTALMEAYISRLKFRGESTARVWICGIAKMIVLGWNKKYAERRKLLLSDEILDSVQSAEGQFDQVSEQEYLYHLEETSKAMELAISSLNCEFKDIFTEHVLNGQSYKSISEKYSIPVGTVKSRIFTARAYIRHAVN